MSYSSQSKKKPTGPQQAVALSASQSVHLQRSVSGGRWQPCLGIVIAVGYCLTCGVAQAQIRSLPSHGKSRIDSYNYLLRDVHPASQAQANYLQNRLFTSELKKIERIERRDRLDAYGERQLIELLEEYQGVTRRLAAGHTVSARNLPTLWVLVSVYGDRSEVYDALSSSVPEIAHEDFVPTSQFLQILEPTGRLKLPPLLLEGAEDVDASKLESAWGEVVKSLHTTGRVSAPEAARFHESVAEYKRQANDALKVASPAVGRFDARKYVDSLGSLADALYRPQQSAQIQQYLRQGGYAYYGDTLLGLIQHMVRNRLAPAQGSTAQIALAEVARPICGVLEQEIAVRFERVDSLAAGEGHRPYASEYRPFDNRGGTTPSTKVSQRL